MKCDVTSIVMMRILSHFMTMIVVFNQKCQIFNSLNELSFMNSAREFQELPQNIFTLAFRGGMSAFLVVAQNIRDMKHFQIHIPVEWTAAKCQRVL